jgi:hypothetical protein
MKRRFSNTEKALFLIPLLGVFLLAAQGPLRGWWQQSPARRWTASYQQDKDTHPNGLRFSHAGRQVAALFWNRNTRRGRLDIVETALQKIKHSLPLSDTGVMTWSPKNDRIVVDGSNGCAAWDLKTEKRILRYLSPPNVHEDVTGWKSNDVLELTDVTWLIFRRQPIQSTSHVSSKILTKPRKSLIM